tara:strand:- start:4958 stop:5272 length:315 start_codon:yes stop_codon:yes gene_type:complete
MNSLRFSYKGYEYSQLIESYEEESWYVHVITYYGKNGVKSISCDYSKRTRMTERAFRLLVDLGFPPRPQGKHSFPWTEETLVMYKEQMDYTNQFTIENDKLSYL